METEKKKFSKTNYCFCVICKCGSCVAASMIYGGISIDEEFMDTAAEIVNDRGGILKLIDITQEKCSLMECKCVTPIDVDPSQTSLF